MLGFLLGFLIGVVLIVIYSFGDLVVAFPLLKSFKL